MVALDAPVADYGAGRQQKEGHEGRNWGTSPDMAQSGEPFPLAGSVDWECHIALASVLAAQASALSFSRKAECPCPDCRYSSWRRNTSHVTAKRAGTRAMLKASGPTNQPGSWPIAMARPGSPSEDGM